jgi:hypothetical protein
LNLPYYLELIFLYFFTVVPSSIYILDGTTVKNKGKLILTEIFPSVQKHDIFFSIENGITLKQV